jgi:hypothetical protein
MNALRKEIVNHLSKWFRGYLKSLKFDVLMEW